MTDTPEIAAARVEVERARTRFMATFDEILDLAQQIQHRLMPSSLMRDAWEGAKEKGADLAEDAVDAVKSRPLAATGVVAAIAMFLAREPLIDLAGKVVGGVGDKRKTPRKRRKSAAKPTQPEAVE